MDVRSSLLAEELRRLGRDLLLLGQWVVGGVESLEGGGWRWYVWVRNFAEVEGCSFELVELFVVVASPRLAWEVAEDYLLLSLVLVGLEALAQHQAVAALVHSVAFVLYLLVEAVVEVCIV